MTEILAYAFLVAVILIIVIGLFVKVVKSNRGYNDKDYFNCNNK